MTLKGTRQIPRVRAGSGYICNLPVIPGGGVLVPGNVIELAELLPTAEPGYVWVWRDGQASQLIDLRNRFVYHKDNGYSVWWSASHQ
jgi:hypothetical protein